MVSKARKLMNEQVEFAGEQARVLRQAPGTLVRRAAARSAARVKALQKPVRVVTRSGVRLATLSNNTVQSLLELQLEVVTAALNNAAEQLERISRARSMRSLLGGQAEELKSARERIAKDIAQVLAILKRAGKGARNVASEALEEVRRPSGAAVAPPARRTGARKTKRAVRKVKRAAPRARR
jgi:phasin family protein